MCGAIHWDCELVSLWTGECCDVSKEVTGEMIFVVAFTPRLLVGRA